MEKLEFGKKIRECFLKEIEIDLTDYQVNQFFLFKDYLIEQNKLFNLTSIVEEEKIIAKHFLDSAELVKFVKNEDDGTKKPKIIDVGTGAGFPAIPLSIIYPEYKFLLLDSLNKRINFLSEVVKLLDLKNVELVCGRAEELGHEKRYREQFDLATSRAVAKFNVLSEFVSCFVKKNGCAYFYKLDNNLDELSEASNALKEMQLELSEELTYILPFDDVKKKIYVFEKVNSLKDCYPRKMKAIKNKPL